MRKLQKSKSDEYRLTIPKAAIKKLGWEKGDFIAFAIDGKIIKLIRGVKNNPGKPEDLEIDWDDDHKSDENLNIKDDKE